MNFEFEITRYEPSIDWEALRDFYLNEDYKEFFRRVPFGYNSADLQKFEERFQCTLFSITAYGHIIGFALLSDIDSFGFNAHFGLMLQKEFQDRQFDNGTPAFLITKHFLKQIFNSTVLNKISMRFLAKREDLVKSLSLGGFKQEGYFKCSSYFKGQMEDEIEMAILHQEFTELYEGKD